MEEAITVEQLHVSYYGKIVIDNVSFSFPKGHLIGIIGPNGAGKSTLIKAILQLIPRDYGTVHFQGEPLKKVQKRIAYVPQRSDIDFDFPISVFDTVLLGTYPHLKLFQRPGKKEKAKAIESLEKVGMRHYSRSQIGELSGGQQQRVFLARALAQGAEYFFLDEPFVGVDATSERVMIDILKQLKESGKTIFVVHHDLAKVSSYFDQLLLLNRKLVEKGSVEEVFKRDVLQKTYEHQFPVFDELGVKV